MATTINVLKRIAVLMAVLTLGGALSPVLAQSGDDPGVDVGWVVTSSANLRSAPYLTASVVRRLSQREIVVLLSREQVDGWFHVIHVDSSDEGWISDTVIDVRYTTSKRSAPKFTSTEVDTYSNPTVTITNDSSENLTLSVGGTRYSIPAYTHRSVEVMPGTCDFYATAPGVLPVSGRKTWKVGYDYTWRFFIRTTY